MILVVPVYILCRGRVGGGRDERGREGGMREGIDLKVFSLKV